MSTSNDKESAPLPPVAPTYTPDDDFLKQFDPLMQSPRAADDSKDDGDAAHPVVRSTSIDAVELLLKQTEQHDKEKHEAWEKSLKEEEEKLGFSL